MVQLYLFTFLFSDIILSHTLPVSNTGFSIDDILSHKTAALKEQKEAASQQSIVRPWDIHVGHVSASGGNGGPSAAATAAMAAALHRKQQQAKASGNNGDDQGDSPLDALFQMASKTFEGLKAKSGKAQGLVFTYTKIVQCKFCF